MVINAEVVGERAKALLGRATTAYVLGRTSRVAFLEVEGEILWFTGPNGSLHRRAIRMPRIPPWPGGSSLTIRQGRLGQPGAEGNIATGVVWRRPSLPSPPPDLRQRAQKVLFTLRPCLARTAILVGPRWLADFRRSLSAWDAGGLVALARERLGYGPGLTPVGDDFLGGAFFALRFGAAESAWLAEVVAAVLLSARDLTHRLSYWLLADLSRGHGPADLHLFARAVFAGQDQPSLTWAQRTLTLGHTTGSALLLGGLTAWSEFTGKEHIHG